MTPAEFASMVDWIEDWWGPSRAWGGADRLAAGFDQLDPAACYEVLMSRQKDPSLVKYPPNPAELKAETLARMRRQVEALPMPRDPDSGWVLYSMKTYGEVLSLEEAVRRRNVELVAEGRAPKGADPP